IQLPEEWKDTYFNNSSLEQVVVYKKEQCWHFHISLEKRLPFEIYEAFLAYTKKAFESIATIKLYLTYQNNEDDITEEFPKYWNDFVVGLTKLLPTKKNILEQFMILVAYNVNINDKKYYNDVTL